MKLLPILLTILLAPLSAVGSETDERALAYAKALSSKALDASLPDQPLEEWFLSGPARLSTLVWSAECDLAPYPEPAEGYPLCVRVRFEAGPLWGVAIIRVGTSRSGVGGEPTLASLFVTSSRLAKTGKFYSTKTLGQLPSLLSRATRSDRAVSNSHRGNTPN
jgi:hypothetical protein